MKKEKKGRKYGKKMKKATAKDSMSVHSGNKKELVDAM